MAIKRPDIYTHNNPNLPIVLANDIKGNKYVNIVTDLYTYSIDKLTKGTLIWVISENKYYILSDYSNYNNINGWSEFTISSSHLTIADKQYANTGVDFGHINDTTQSIYGIKTFENNTNFNGTVTFYGNINQVGTGTIVFIDELRVADNIIYTRENATIALNTNEVSGIQIVKYDGTNDAQIIVKNDGLFRTGIAGGTLRRVANIVDSPTNKFVKYNTTLDLMETVDISSSNLTDNSNLTKLNGIQTFTETNTFSKQIISTLISGTSPFTVNSNTMVDNLNSDFLDGQHGSYYLNFNNFTNIPNYSLDNHAHAIYLPYTGAVNDLNLNTHNLIISKVYSDNVDLLLIGGNSLETNSNIKLINNAGINIYTSTNVNIESLTLTHNNNTVWTSNNDGSTSGLDSDLLDAQHGTYYLDYNNFTNKPNLTYVAYTNIINTFTQKQIATQFESNAIQGLPPFIINSTTKVEKLNVDYLDSLSLNQTGVNYIPYVDINGNFGIGVNPSELFHIKTIDGLSADIGIQVGNNYGWRIRVDSNDYQFRIDYVDSNFDNFSNKLSILKNGNIGIGYNTPSEKLHINGNIKADILISSTTILSPLDISSVIKVDNLNSDMVDGKHIQSNLYDTTDSILLVGSFGLGANIFNQVINVNDLSLRPGYYIYNNDNGSINGATNYGYLYQFSPPDPAENFPTWFKQMFFSSNTSNPQLYLRTGSGTQVSPNYGAWKEIYHSANINNLTTNLNANNLTIAGQLTATIGTGTTPMIITSTTKVDNLNVDLLNGLNSSAFAQINAINTFLQNNYFTNVGIGTTSLNRKFEVVTSNTGVSEIISQYRNNTTTVNSGLIQRFTISTNNTQNIGGEIEIIRKDTISSGDSDMIIRTSTSTTMVDRIYIKSNGNIGLNNNNPSEILDVTGNALISGSLKTDNTLVFRNTASAMTTSIDFKSANNYTKTLAGNEVWSFSNIKSDVGIVSEVTIGGTLYTITCTQSGVTFKGDVNSSGVIQSLAINKQYLIGFLALSTTLIWVSVKENKA